MRSSSKAHLKSYLLLSILILQICHSDSYLAGDQQIKDLDTEDLRFVTDAQAWTSSPLWSATTTLYSICGTKYLIGGYGVLGGVGQSGSNVNMLWVSRTYTDLPTHTGIMFSFLFAMVDSWDVGDLISFQFDTVSFNGWNMASPSTGPPNLCGLWYGDLFVQVSGTLVHSASTLTFTIYASNDELTTNESFGVRDITLQFFTGTSSFTNQLCGKATQNIPVGSVCPCPDGKYLAPAPSNVCTPCDPSCALCYGGSNTECYKCKSGYSFYEDGCFACHTSCATCNGNDANQCTSCITGYALTILNTCVALNDCFPLALDSFDATCTSPCPANTVLDWQGNCLSSCTSPRTKTQFGVFICDFPCTTTQYLYWTGVCQNSCPSYYQTVQFKSRNLCNPNCPLNQFYLVAQKQCVDNCPEGFFANTNTLLCQACGMSRCAQCLSTSPQNCKVCQQGTIKDTDGICKTCQAMTVDYVKGIEKGFQYRVRLTPTDCDLDVSIVQAYLKGEEPSLDLFPPFTFDISKVKSNVYQVNINFDASFVEANNLDISLQYLEGVMPIKKKFIPSPALEELAKSLPTAQKTIASVMGASFIGTLGIGALVLLWSLLNFQQFISIFMFINVDYPFQVQMFFSMFEDISWNILPNPLAYLTESWAKDVLKLDNDVMKEYLPPARFEDHNVTSFFIQNGGVMIFTNGLLLIILVIPLLLMKISYFRKNKILRYIKAKLRWNVIARTFLENGVPLALATFLQLRIMMFDRTYLIICSIFAALSAIYLITLSVFLTQVVRDRPHDVLKKEVIRNIYGTLYEGVEMEKMGGKFYHLLILYRGVLLAALVVFSEKYPLMQTTIPIYYGFGLLYYIFNFVTFENKKLNIINRIKEILLLTCLISVLFLQFNVNSLEYYDILGWFIVACLSIAFLLEMGYVIISQIFNIKPLSLQLYTFLKKVYNWLAKKCYKDKRIRKRVRRPSRSRILD